MAIDLQKLQLKFDALFNDPNFVTDFEQWLEARNVRQNSGKPFVSGSLPNDCVHNWETNYYCPEVDKCTKCSIGNDR